MTESEYSVIVTMSGWEIYLRTTLYCHIWGAVGAGQEVLHLFPPVTVFTAGLRLKWRTIREITREKLDLLVDQS